MRRALVPVCLSWLLLAGSSLAGEGAPVSTRLQQSRAFDSYSACIVQLDPRTADQLALESRYGGELGPLVNKLMPSMKACLRSNDQALLRISPYLLRGELARALLLQGATASRPYTAPTDEDLAGKNGERARLERVIAGFSACLVEAAPDASAAFVRALGGSPEERAVFPKLASVSEGCAQPAPGDVKLGSDNLRTGLAIALYGRAAG